MKSDGAETAAGVEGRSGFTLVEMLVVCGLVMLLAGLLVAAGADLRKQALIKETQTRLAVLGQAIENYYSERRFYPYAQEVGNLGVSTTDAWGNPVQYRGKDTLLDSVVDPSYNTTTFDLWSYGPDGTDNSGGGDDINNWSRL